MFYETTIQIEPIVCFEGDLLPFVVRSVQVTPVEFFCNLGRDEKISITFWNL